MTQARKKNRKCTQPVSMQADRGATGNSRLEVLSIALSHFSLSLSLSVCLLLFLSKLCSHTHTHTHTRRAISSYSPLHSHAVHLRLSNETQSRSLHTYVPFSVPYHKKERTALVRVCIYVLTYVCAEGFKAYGFFPLVHGSAACVCARNLVWGVSLSRAPLFLRGSECWD